MTQVNRISLTLLFVLAISLLIPLWADPLWSDSAPPATSKAPFHNSVKKALQEGKVVIGAAVNMGSADAAATLADAGFDFVWIEMEHSPITLESAREMILATRGLKAVPFIRVPEKRHWLAKRVLDIGSLGVIFPFVSTRQQAQQAVAACKYPPEGIRGFGPTLAAARWGLSSSDYAGWANDNVMVITLIESKEGVENIEEIASVPGVDLLFIGTSDLSYSLDVGGQVEHPRVEQAVARVLAAGKKYKVPVGYPSGDPAQMKKRVKQGFRVFLVGSDVTLLRAGARQVLTGASEAIPGSIY